jgi:protein-disulfide isomerase
MWWVTVFVVAAVLSVAVLPFALTASAETVRGTTSDGALEVAVTPSDSGFGMEFINPVTGETQEHVDYTVAISNGGEYIFGPIPLTHTSPGRVTIPAILGDGTNQIEVSVHGILFRPIDEETLTLEVVLGAQAERSVPGWVKTNAGWWAEGLIDDGAFLTGIEYLISEGTIAVEATPGGESSGSVPGWVKTTAGWWAEGLVSDGEFLNALEYLIGQGAITIVAPEATVLGGVDLSHASAPYGDDDAPITIIEFGDYQCPNCKSWFDNTRPAIQSEYVDAGIARIYFVDLAFIGPDSAGAAAASYCAEEQSMYWEYHDELYRNQGSIQSGWASDANLVQYATGLGLDAESFGACLARDHSERIQFNALQAQGIGIDRTPSFVIVGSGGVETISGNQPYAAFEAAVQSLLG